MPIAYSFFLGGICSRYVVKWAPTDPILLPIAYLEGEGKWKSKTFFPVLRCASICPEPWICSWPRWWEIGNGSDLIFANFCLHEEASDLKRSHADIRWTQIASMSFHFPQFSLLNKDKIFPKYFLKVFHHCWQRTSCFCSYNFSAATKKD